MKQNWLKSGGMMLLASLMFLAVSCVDGYEDEFTWTSKLVDLQLESPASVTQEFSPDGTSQTIRWTEVKGATGYEVSVFNVDDPNNPVTLVDNRRVDALFTNAPATENTKYKATVRTLGNPRKNNKDALNPTMIEYNNMLEVYRTIGDGDLTQWFTENPVPQDSVNELCYELTGSAYTMSGSINIGNVAVTMRGSKANPPIISITDGSFISGGGKLRLQFMELDYAGFAGDANAAAIVLMDAARAGEPNANNWVIVPSISIESCKITKKPGYIFYCNNQRYGIGDILIKDCKIESLPAFSQALLRFQQAVCRNITITNSTLYCETKPSSGSQRLVQFNHNQTWNNVGNPDWPSVGRTTLISNTFYQLGYTAQSYNSNGSTIPLICQKNIFVDCFENGRIISRLIRGGSSLPEGSAVGQNTQWYDGAFRTGSQDVSLDMSPIDTDPELTYYGSGVFDMRGSAQISARTGDPRWLP